jgi:hypothetical protein
VTVEVDALLDEVIENHCIIIKFVANQLKILTNRINRGTRVGYQIMNFVLSDTIYPLRLMNNFQFRGIEL